MPLFEAPETVLREYFAPHIADFEETIVPSYILEKPYCDILRAVASGDGKLYSALHKARVPESAGETIVRELCEKGVLYREESREAPLKRYPKQKIKKSLRHYRIQDKLRFRKPFLRFWFGFVEPFKSKLFEGDYAGFVAYYLERKERLNALVFEQLSDALLETHFARNDPLSLRGSYWDKENEFDIVAVTQSGRVVVGECKYKERKVCKNELNKLKAKSLQSGIKADIYALFSKAGFSNELLGMRDENLLLFELKDLKCLCDDEG